MYVKKEIKFNVERENKNLIVYGRQTAGFVLGTNTFFEDWKIKDRIKKVGQNKYIIPLDLVEEKLKLMKERKRVIEEKIEIMEQVVNNGKNMSKGNKK